MTEAVRAYAAWAAEKRRDEPAPPLPAILAEALSLDLRLKPHELDATDAGWLSRLREARAIWDEAHRPARERQQKAAETAAVQQEMAARLQAAMGRQRVGRVG